MGNDDPLRIARQDEALRNANDPGVNMMHMMQGCSGWLMAAGGAVTYGALILVGAASIKYLFFGKPNAR